MKTVRKWLFVASTAILLTLAQSAIAQGPPPPHHPPPPHGGDDPMRKDFFAPEIVMRHQGDISLTEEQRKFIIAQMQEAQKNFTEWQWSLQAEMEKMGKLAQGPKVDEAQLLSQLDKVLALEKQIKTQQLKLMVSVKNKLTAEQQKILQELKDKRGEQGPGPGPGPRGK